MSAKTNYFENKLTDFLWRAQTLTIGGSTATWSAAPTFYIALFKVAPTDATAGTEHTGGSYARQPIIASLENMAGTQAAASTTASSGTNGTTSNNAAITFADMPDTSISGTNGTVAFGIFDAITGGNLLEYAAITGAPVLASAGATLTFAAGALTIQEDND
jgi:hypothetical protein